MATLLRSLAALLLLSPASLLAQPSTGAAADGVLGQPDFTTRASGLSASEFNGPNGVAVDPASGKLFVADRGNHRVLRFSSEAAVQQGGAAEAVFGQSGFGSGASGLAADRMNNPIGVHVDGDGRLWVTDFSNNRVLRFDAAASKPTGAPADGVLGQPDFTSGSSGLSASGMRGPVTAFADAAGRVWVTEFSNHRVTRFDDAASKVNGAAADGVLGQPDFVTGGSGLSESALRSPNASYVDAGGRLYVSDSGNRRVLRFDAAASKANGAAADGVLGQPDFVTAESNVTREGMTSLRYVFGDQEGRLYVVQEGSHRITIYNDAADRPNGAPADAVLGQPDFTTGTAEDPPTASGFNTPRAIYVDDARDRVWVADWRNNRVLRFDVLPAEVAALTLAAPNGGESVAIGTVYTIRWSSQNVAEIGIEYRTDDGAAWTPIATVAADSGQYDWTVTGPTTAQARVRIYSTASPSVEDVSDAPFSIVEPNERVTIVSPNGYQRWTSGQTRRILFDAQDVSSVDLFYSLDDGASYEPIATGVDAAGGPYEWEVPKAESAKARVRITRSGDPSVADASDAPFTITQEPTVGAQELIFFAGSPTGGFLDPSFGFASGGSTLDNRNTKLPLSAEFALLDNYSVRLSWTSASGGNWGAAIASPGFIGRDLTSQDTLRFRVFTETDLPKSALPVLYVEDRSNRRTPAIQLAAYAGDLEANIWNRVAIPISVFEGNPGTTDLSQIKTVFFGQNQADGQARTVYVDDLRATDGETISGKDRTVIVVLGSSTAAGTGASRADSSWVGRYRAFVQKQDPEARVVNLAIGGFTTYDVLPTGATTPSGRPSPKPNNNITAALGYQPTAIIVNLPSNDASIGATVPEQMANFRTIRDAAQAQDVPIWFTTTQPRNFADDARRQNLMAARDSILTQFAPRAINFWTGIATATGTIEPAFNSGDGIHLNDAGHRLLYNRVVEAGVFVSGTVGTETGPRSGLVLGQNYPNPSGTATAIRFSIPTSTARTTLDVFDLLGRRVASLVDGPMEAGDYTVPFDASALSSGVYVYRLEAAGEVLIRRMIVAR